MQGDRHSASFHGVVLHAAAWRAVRGTSPRRTRSGEGRCDGQACIEHRSLAGARSRAGTARGVKLLWGQRIQAGCGDPREVLTPVRNGVASPRSLRASSMCATRCRGWRDVPSCERLRNPARPLMRLPEELEAREDLRVDPTTMRADPRSDVPFEWVGRLARMRLHASNVCLCSISVKQRAMMSEGASRCRGSRGHLAAVEASARDSAVAPP